MKKHLVGFGLAVFLVAGLGWSSADVSTQVMPMKFDQGATGLGLALRQLPVEGTVLYVTAHPDDENNGVLVALNRGRGLKTSLLTVTRGDGGQNEIGPELFQAIGISIQSFSSGNATIIKAQLRCHSFDTLCMCKQVVHYIIDPGCVYTY